MERRPTLHDRFAKLRAQRWSREALLAVLLTIAAVVFMATALFGSGSLDKGGESVETARTPPG